MAVDLRIKEHPILEFKRGKKINLYYGRKKIDAYEGETIGAALFASGIKTLTRSVKYHRPRGFFCAIGKCSSCFMRVDGVPNVRTCITPVKDGMKIEPQNCFPSPTFDIYGILDKFTFPAGSYYRLFTGPRFVNSLFLKLIRHLTGLGKFPEVKAEAELPTNEWKDTEVAVVGGGPAGILAAVNAAKLGCKVVLIDENQRLGGQLVKQTHKFSGSKKYFAGMRGIEIAKKLSEEVKRQKNIEILLNASVIGIYKGNVLAVVKEGKFINLHAKRIIICTGAYEKTLIFENNDLPGIMGAGGVQTLMNVYGIKPGNEALIVGAGNVGLILAYQLLQADVKVVAIVEAAPKIGGYLVHASKIRRMGVPILTSHSIKRAFGRNQVKGATIVQLDEKWNVIEGSEKDLKCDLICIATGLKPTYELFYQAGCEMKFIPELGGHVPLRTKYMETTVKGLYVAGDASGIEEATTAMIGGKIAGISAALSLGYGDVRAERLRERAIRELEKLRASPISARIRAGLEKALIGEK